MPIRDAAAIEKLWKHAVGDHVTLTIGGRLDPKRNRPLEISGTVKRLVTLPGFERIAVLDLGPVHLVITEGPALAIRHRRIGGHDLLVLHGAEPDFRWHAFATAVTSLARDLEVRLWISLGAIPAAVPHTRSVPVLGSSSRPDLLLGHVQPGPAGTLRVPSAALSVLEHAVGETGIPATTSMPSV